MNHTLKLASLQKFPANCVDASNEIELAGSSSHFALLSSFGFKREGRLFSFVYLHSAPDERPVSNSAKNYDAVNMAMLGVLMSALRPHFVLGELILSCHDLLRPSAW